MSGWSKLLNTVFPAFEETERTKPKGMLYIAEETPGLPTAFAVAGQHAIVLLMLVVYTVIVGREIGLSQEELRGFVSMAIVAAGIATFLQGTMSRFGSGHLVVHLPTPVTMAGFIAVSVTFGIGAAAGATILSGIVVMSFSRLLPKLRSVFPAEVAGVLLVLLGLSLVEGGVRRFTGFSESGLDTPSILIATTVLVVIIGLSVWTSGRLKLFAVVIGTSSGLIVATILGRFGQTELQAVTEQPLFSLPFSGYPLPTPTLVLAATIPILLIEVISAVDSIGTGVAIDKINNAKWHRADMPMIARLVTCHGIGVLLAGLFGTNSIGTSSANLGLVHASGVASRRVGQIAGLMLVVLAFFPQVATFITLIPQPIVGAILVYTAGYMLVAGMELVLSRMLNSRRMFMIGLGITVGSVVLLMPEIISGAPENLKPILGSALTLGTVTAMTLNMIFRIGIAQSGTLQLTGIDSLTKLTDFLEEKGEDWGARRQVMMRAGIAVGEALEKLSGSGITNWPVDLKVSYDEYKIVLELDYAGEPINLSIAKPLSLEDLLDDDDDDALDEMVSNVSGMLISQLADKVESKSDNGRATLKLVFDH